MPSGHEYQDVFGPPHDRHHRIVIIRVDKFRQGGLAPCAAVAQIPHGFARVFENKSFYVVFRPPEIRDPFGALGSNDEPLFAAQAAAIKSVAAQRGHGRCGRTQVHLRRFADLVVDVVRRLRAKHGHRTGVGRQPALDVKRAPRAALFVFSHAVRIFARMSVRGHVGHAGLVAGDIDQDQAQGAPHRCIGPPALSEYVVFAVDVEFMAYRAVDDEQVGARVSGGLPAVEVVFRLHHDLDGGNQHRQIFRQAACHDRVDGNLLDRRHAVFRRNDRDHVIALAVGITQHGTDRGLRRRINGQTVGPALFVIQFEYLEDILK